jgi:hypothetical protein
MPSDVAQLVSATVSLRSNSNGLRIERQRNSAQRRIAVSTPLSCLVYRGDSHIDVAQRCAVARHCENLEVLPSSYFGSGLCNDRSHRLSGVPDS